MTDLSLLALLTSFAAGVISFLSPCVLPLVPGYVSYVAGQSLQAQLESRANRRRSLRLGLLFVAGFSTVFITLGASATALGQLLLAHRYAENLIGGGIIVVFGLAMLGVAVLPWLPRDIRFHRSLAGGGPLRAYVLGLAFAFGWTPCIGPVLGTILTASAVSATVAHGVSLLGAYSAGLALPFLVATRLTSRLVGRIRSLGRIGRSLQVGAGASTLLLGLAMITNQLSAFSYWLLGAFPVLARIG